MDLPNVDGVEFDAICPNCGRTQEVHSSANNDGAMPEPGDISICFGCTGIAMYGLDLQLELLTKEHYDEVMLDLDINRAIAALRQFKQRVARESN